MVYQKGTKPISDSCWQAFKIEGGEFVNVGKPFRVRGSVVGREMDRAHSIKGHEPYNIAHRIAVKRFGRIADVEKVSCRRHRR